MFIVMVFLGIFTKGDEIEQIKGINQDVEPINYADLAEDPEGENNPSTVV